MSQISCRGCRQWFDSLRMSCPECDWVRPGYNPYMERVKLDRNLYESLEASKPANQYAETYKHYRSEVERVYREL